MYIIYYYKVNSSSKCKYRVNISKCKMYTRAHKHHPHSKNL